MNRPSARPVPPEGGESVRGLGHGVLWTTTDTVMRIAADIFLLAYAVRRVGLADFGIFALATTVMSLFATVDFGLGAAVVRAAARERDCGDAERASARRDIATAHAAYVMMAGALVLATLVLLPVLPTALNTAGHDRDLRVTLALVGVALSFTVASAAIVAVGTGERRFRVVASSSIVGQAVNVGTVTLLLGNLGVVALGVGRLVGAVIQCGVLVVWIRAAVPWFKLRPRTPQLAEVRRVAAFALPLLVIASGSQIVAATDLLVIGALATAAQVGVYRASGAVPSRALVLLFAGYDTTYPYLARGRGPRQEETLLRWACTVFSYLAGIGFGFMIWSRGEIIPLLLGHDSELGQKVFVLFCLAWITNVPAHGLTLVLIARGRQRSFIPVVAAELTLNVALTIVLVAAIGPIGAATATLVTISVTDYFVLPFVVRHQFESNMSRMLLHDGVAPTALGLLMSFMTVTLAGGHGAPRLIATAALTGVVGACVGLLALNADGRAFLRVAVSGEA